MPKRNTKINVILYLPSSQDGKNELAQRIASVHADAVLHQIKKMDCPSTQKTELLDAIIIEAKKERVAHCAASMNTSTHTLPLFPER